MFYIYLILVVALFVAFALQGAIVYYFGIGGAIASGLVLAAVTAFAFVFFSLFAKGQNPTGYTVSESEKTAMFIAPFFTSLLIIAVISIGAFYWAEYLKTGLLNKPVFFIWLGFAVGGPVLYLGANELSSLLKVQEKTKYFVPASITISHFIDLPIHIDQLRFVNSTNGKESRIVVSILDRISLQGVARGDGGGRKDLSAMSDLKFRQEIPRGTDKFYMSWYSFVEDKYYSDEFPFPEEKFPLEEHAKQTRQLQVVNLLIQPKGKVALFTPGRSEIFPYSEALTKPIAEDEKQQMLQRLKGRSFDPITEDELTNLFDKIAASGILEKRVEMREKKFLWMIAIESPGEVKKVKIKRFNGLANEPTYSSLQEVDKRWLPASLSFYIYNSEKRPYTSVHFFMDNEKLYDKVLALTSANEEVPVEFLLAVNELHKEEIEFFIKSGEQTIVFEDYETNIVRYDK